MEKLNESNVDLGINRVGKSFLDTQEALANNRKPGLPGVPKSASHRAKLKESALRYQQRIKEALAKIEK